jgi:hypothetical protein
MKTMIACLGICLALGAAERAHAVLIGLLASDNAQVQPGGPRSGINGKAFFNIEGSSNGNFSSFGVADFQLMPFPPIYAPLLGVSLRMTQSNAGFSNSGPLSIYLTSQTGVDIQSTNTNLNYVSGMNGLASVDSDLAPLTLIGSGSYVETANGTAETFPLNFPGGLPALQTAINNGAMLRIVVTPDAADTAATYAGTTNTTYLGPSLVFEAAPEPGGALLACWGAALALRMFTRSRTTGGQGCAEVAAT